VNFQRTYKNNLAKEEVIKSSQDQIYLINIKHFRFNGSGWKKLFEYFNKTVLIENFNKFTFNRLTKKYIDLINQVAGLRLSFYNFLAKIENYLIFLLNSVNHYLKINNMSFFAIENETIN